MVDSKKLYCDIIKMVLDNLESSLDVTEVDNSMALDEIPGWSSLGWVSIMSAVQEKFNIKVSIEDVENIITIGDLVTYISGHTET